MSEKRKYLKIEERIFKSFKKTGYVIIFTLIFSLFMCVLNFVLYCVVDNFFTMKFLLKGEMKFSQWWNLMCTTYHFPYLKLSFFSIIILLAGIYRSNTLAKEFSK